MPGATSPHWVWPKVQSECANSDMYGIVDLDYLMFLRLLVSRVIFEPPKIHSSIQ